MRASVGGRRYTEDDFGKVARPFLLFQLAVMVLPTIEPGVLQV